jgi:hypothetical protein
LGGASSHRPLFLAPAPHSDLDEMTNGVCNRYAEDFAFFASASGCHAAYRGPSLLQS